MIFSSQFFIFLFLPVCLIIYYILPKICRNAVLLFFSIIFYAWGQPDYWWKILLSIFINYVAGLVLEKFEHKKLVLFIAISINVIFLLHYKYTGFFYQTFNLKINNYIRNIILPLGISFYTFHSISYLVDIYRKKATPQRNLFKMGLYIMNFAQLIAGPIIRYQDVESQLTKRKHSLNHFANGLCLFVIGLSKKIIIANVMGEMVDAMFARNTSYLDNLQVWVGVLAYTLQIYFDFSGYSDMAIGLGRMFGFEFKKNFNFPYISKNIREFWRRWHISLSNWFRDYLYIPLGGNKKSKARTAFNLFVVFFLCGLWHGAQTTFVVWGLYHGAFLAFERGAFGRLLDKLPSFIKKMYMWMVVMVGWVFFRSENITHASYLIRKMFFFDHVTNPSVEISSFINGYFITILLIGLLFALKIPYRLYMHIIRKGIINSIVMRSIGYAALFVLFLICISDIVSNNYNPFIYYKF